MNRGRQVSPNEFIGPGTVWISRPTPVNFELPPELQEKQNEALARVAELKAMTPGKRLASVMNLDGVLNEQSANISGKDE